MRFPIPQESIQAAVRVRAGWLACNVLAALAATVLGTTPLAAQAKPDFSGTWKMNVAESKADVGGPKSLAFTIEHKEPAFSYKASGEDFQGEPFEESGEFKIDGKEYPGPAGLMMRAHWEGQVLVVQIGLGKTPVQTVSLRLSEDAKRLTRDVILKDEDGDHSMYQIFDKQ